MAIDKTPDRVGSRSVTLRNDKMHNLYLLYTTDDYIEEDQIDRNVARVKKYINLLAPELFF